MELTAARRLMPQSAVGEIVSLTDEIVKLISLPQP